MIVRTNPFGVWADSPVYLHSLLEKERAAAMREHLEMGATPQFVIEKFVPVESGYRATGLVVSLYPGKSDGNVDEELRRVASDFVGTTV